MNNTSSISFQEAAASMSDALKAPNAPRALLVSLDRKGGFALQPVVSGQSVLNLQTDLVDHLNSFPVTDAWLSEMLDYFGGRIAARAEAKRTGGFCLPRSPGNWEIAHTQAFKAVSHG